MDNQNILSFKDIFNESELNIHKDNLNISGTSDGILAVISGELEPITVSGTLSFDTNTLVLTGSEDPVFDTITIGSLSGILKATAGLVSGSATTSDLPEGSNLYYTSSRFNTDFSSKTTDDLAEGKTNFYYSDEKVDDRVSVLIQDGVGLSWSYNDSLNTLTGNLPQNISTSSNVQFAKLGIGVSPTRFLDVLGTTEQLRLAYNASTYTSFTTNSAGDLTIAPSGGDVSLSGYRLFTGNYASLGLGYNALFAGYGNDYNTAIGYNAMPALTTGSNNFACGSDCMRYLTSGSSNVALGASCLAGLSSGSYNTGIGKEVLPNSNNSYNIGIGYQVGLIHTGGSNVFIGPLAARVGSGNNNIAIGTYSFYTSGAGSSNVILGHSSGGEFSGSNSIILGNDAGNLSATTGSNNILIGRGCNFDSTTQANSIKIGFGSTPYTTCKIQGIYNNSSSPTSPYLIGIGSDGLLGKDSSDNTLQTGQMLKVIKTSEQLRLAYNASNYTSFTVNSSGYLTLSNNLSVPVLSIGSLSGLLKASAGLISGSATTDDLTEGKTNLYHTTARARSSISAGSGISYDSSTGVISNSGVLSLTGTSNQINVSASTGSITLSTPQDIGTTSSPTFSNITINDSSYPTLSLKNTGTERIQLQAPVGAYSYISGVNSTYLVVNNLGASSSGSIIIQDNGTIYTSNPLLVQYDGTNYTTFSSSSSGDLTITPTGGDTNIVGNLNVSGLTASRLLSTDSSKNLSSVSNLASWVAGTSNQITVTNDGDGSITLSTPQDINTSSSPTFTGMNVSGLTASRLLSSDGSKNLSSVSNLASWVAGTSNQITVTNDGDGSITLSTPQDIGTGSSPSFTGLTVNSYVYSYYQQNTTIYWSGAISGVVTSTLYCSRFNKLISIYITSFIEQTTSSSDKISAVGYLPSNYRPSDAVFHTFLIRVGGTQQVGCIRYNSNGDIDIYPDAAQSNFSSGVTVDFRAHSASWSL